MASLDLDFLYATASETGVPVLFNKLFCIISPESGLTGTGAEFVVSSESFCTVAVSICCADIKTGAAIQKINKKNTCFTTTWF